MTISDPLAPAAERLHVLEAVGLGLSPMHPVDWRAINAERRFVLVATASPPLHGDAAELDAACWARLRAHVRAEPGPASWRVT